MKKELTVQPSDASLNALRNSFPQDPGFTRMMLPRLTLVSQDVVEDFRNPKTGKKEIRVITEAGTFLFERETEDTDEETGRQIWEKTELGNKVDGTIIFQRKQLKMFVKDEGYTSTPIFDIGDEDTILPLFKGKEKIATGTISELKAMYNFVDDKGKTRSKLGDNTILYILIDGEMYQMNIGGTSMYAFKDYAKHVLCPSVVTTLCSVSRENGTTKWNQMTFTTKSKLKQDEVDNILIKISEIQQGIAAEKNFFGKQAVGVSSTEMKKLKAQADKDF